MTSLPNDPYPICPLYDNWYNKDPKEKELDCNWNVLHDLIQNITKNDEHTKTCFTTQYHGKITQEMDNEEEVVEDNGQITGNGFFVYTFAMPLKAKVYEEYLITDGFTLIGSVGGTLGLFIGFSISNVVYCIMDLLESIVETHFSRK